MGIENFNGTPFKEKLEPTDYDSRMVQIRELRSHANKLVRERELLEGEGVREVIKAHAEAKGLFEGLHREYGINVVSMDAVVGRNEEGKKAIFTIVDKIEGNNLSKIEQLPPSTKEDLDVLFSSLGQHYDDAWRQNGKYWADANNNQFVYGHKPGEKADHFFLVDVDARFFSQHENELFAIEWVIHNVCESIVNAEHKFQPPVRLEEARSKFLELISEMEKEKPDNEWLVKARKLLES